MKTWHWMLMLPAIALAFKVARCVIEAGMDGRIVYHQHEWGEINPHPTPYSARLWAVMRGKESAIDYACPLNDAPIEREWIVWSD